MTELHIPWPDPPIIMQYYIDDYNRFLKVDIDTYEEWRNNFDIQSTVPKLEVIIDDMIVSVEAAYNGKIKEGEVLPYHIFYNEVMTNLGMHLLAKDEQVNMPDALYVFGSLEKARMQYLKIKGNINSRLAEHNSL